MPLLGRSPRLGPLALLIAACALIAGAYALVYVAADRALTRSMLAESQAISEVAHAAAIDGSGDDNGAPAYLQAAQLFEDGSVSGAPTTQPRTLLTPEEKGAWQLAQSIAACNRLSARSFPRVSGRPQTR